MRHLDRSLRVELMVRDWSDIARRKVADSSLDVGWSCLAGEVVVSDTRQLAMRIARVESATAGDSLRLPTCSCSVTCPDRSRRRQSSSQRRAGFVGLHCCCCTRYTACSRASIAGAARMKRASRVAVLLRQLLCLRRLHC